MSSEIKFDNSIHPSIIDKVDPEYVAFHNAHFLNIPSPEALPWNPDYRLAPPLPGGSEPLDVGSTKDYNLSKTDMRVFTPKGTRPVEGWPVLVWFHGGGWTLGNISSETSFITRMVTAANCVVVSVNYRLAPENPYPAAVEDAVEALEWVVTSGPGKIDINPTRVAVGGASSGGNLAATLTLKAAEKNIPLIFQLLVVPLTNNTATVDDLWAENQHAPFLSPVRMEWFRGNYLPNKEDWAKWDASPALAPPELVRKVPKTWIGICEMDILRDDAIQYAEKLRKEGVEVEFEIYKGAPHVAMALDGIVLSVGKKLVSDAGAALVRALVATSL